MNAIPWYRSPVFVGVLVSAVAQVIPLAGIVGVKLNLTEDQLTQAAQGVLQLVSFGSALYALVKRKTSPLQPVTMTQKKADEKTAEMDTSLPLDPTELPRRPPQANSHWLVPIFIGFVLALSSAAYTST